MFRTNKGTWSPIEDGDKTLDSTYLDQAGADAAKQLDYLRNGLVNPARVLAEAAYSLWYLDYDELMQLGRYLTRRQEDSSERFPGVRERPTGSNGVEQDEGADAENLDEEDDDEQNLAAQPGEEQQPKDA